MARKPPIKRIDGLEGDITRRVSMRTLMKSAAPLGITAQQGEALETYIRELDRLLVFALAADEDNSELHCKDEIRRAVYAAKQLLAALQGASDKSRARINSALRGGAPTLTGVKQLTATVQSAVAHLESIDRKAWPSTSIASVHADIGAKLIRLYEQHLPGQQFSLGDKLVGQPGFQYAAPAAEWFALTMRIIFPKILISQLTTAAEAAREIAGQSARTSQGR
jgi:hypothetical protein